MRIRFIYLLTISLLLTRATLAQAVIKTAAGTDFVFTGDGKPAPSVSIGQVFGVSVDGAGRAYFASPTHNMIFRLLPGGTIERVAGNGFKGFSGEGAAATAASLNFPTGVLAAPDGTVFIADFENHKIRQIRADGTIVTVAGDSNATAIGDGGSALLASIYLPAAVALDRQGRLYIADNGNHRIRRVDANGIIHTIAGTGEPGYSGDGGPATSATLHSPQGIAVDAFGVVYFSDTQTHTVRRIALDGVISTVAGQGTPGFAGDGGMAAAAMLREPRGLAIDAAGQIYVADSGNHRLRRIRTDGRIETAAGTGVAGFAGDGALATGATLNEPAGVAAASDGTLYIADLANARLRRIAPNGLISTVAGNGQSRFSGDGGPAAAAALDNPQGVGAARDGSILIADSVNNRIRRVGPDGTITTIAGTGAAGFSGDGGPATSARLHSPQGSVVEDRNGNILFCDRRNNRVRIITRDGAIRTLAGNGAAGFSGDGGPATAAALDFPSDVDIDADGNIFIADSRNQRIRRVRPNGVIDTVAGTGARDFSGDGGPATLATFREPYGVTAGPQGVLYICDQQNGRVRKIAADGVIDTIAGNGELTFTGDGPATESGINGPLKAILDSEGRLLIVDIFSARIRRLNSSGNLETVAGNGEMRFSGDGGPPAEASLLLPVGIAFRPNGNLLIADAGNSRIREILPSAPSWTLSRNAVSMTGQSNGLQPPAESVTATSSIPGVRFNARAETLSGGNWLTIASPGQFLTQTLSIAANPRGLAMGEYRGQIIIETPGATPPEARIDVTFLVTGGQGPALEVVPESLSFSVAEGQAEQKLVLLRNHGAEAVLYSVQIVESAAERWMQAEAPSGVVGPDDPVPVVLRASAAALSQGTYNASLRVTNQRTLETTLVPVRLVITPAQPVLRLAVTGLTFQAMEGPSAADFPQKVAVLNSGSGAMNWTAAIVEANPPPRWLSLASNAGTSNALGQTIPEFTVNVSAGGLAVGEYRAAIRVDAPGAASGTQQIDVVLNVIPRTATPRPYVSRTALISVASEGAAPPGSLETGILNLQQRTLEFRAFSGSFGGNWFRYRPDAGSLESLETRGIAVQPDQTGLAPGVYDGAITFIFPGQDPRNVRLLLLVTPRANAPQADTAGPAPVACEASRLETVFTRLANGFVVKPGQPVPIEVEAIDNCGVPLREGLAIATFDDGAPPVVLTSLRDGRWTGTWRPRERTGNPGVTVRVVVVSTAGNRLQKELVLTGRTGADIQR